MAQDGIWSWAIYDKENPVWLAGREIGTGDNLFANIRPIWGPGIGGVPVGDGFFAQATRPSPKAPVILFGAFALDFQPQLDEDSERHIQAVQQAHALPSIWLPVPILNTWKITSGRVTYSVPGTISGSAGTRGAYNEPIVEIRQAGTLDSSLTYAASSPGSTEFTLPGATTADHTAIEVGDISASAGKDLCCWSWQMIEVRIINLEHGFDGANRWTTTLSVTLAPSRRDFEADA